MIKLHTWRQYRVRAKNLSWICEKECLYLKNLKNGLEYIFVKFNKVINLININVI